MIEKDGDGVVGREMGPGVAGRSLQDIGVPIHSGFTELKEWQVWSFS